MVLKSRVAAKVRPSNSSVKKIIIKNYKNYYFFNDACGEMPLQSSHQRNSGTVYVSKRLQSNIAPGISSSDSVTVLSAISNIDCMSQPALYVCEIKSICEPPPALQYTC